MRRDGGWLRRRVLLVATRADVHRRVDGLVLLPVPQHAVLQGESPAANIAGERSFAGVRPHVTSEILRGPEPPHTESADHLCKKIAVFNRDSVTRYKVVLNQN